MAAPSKSPHRLSLAAAIAVLVLLATGCGAESGDESIGDNSEGNRPTIAVTTNILGDVVGELIDDQADVITIMPVGADPHSFQASAQEINQLLGADALIVNGGGFEEGLLDVIDSATEDGVATYEALDAVAVIEGEEHDDEDHDEHDHSGADPHFFTDPVRMSDTVPGLVEFLKANVPTLDAAALDAAASDYLDELDTLHTDVAAMMAAIPAERRVLVTDHEVFGYFADRYEFELVGAVIPGGTTVESGNAGNLVELAELIKAEGVPAIFVDSSSPNDLAETLADEIGDIAVVELYSESLGEQGSDGATYLDMIRTNASRIAEALG